MPGLRGETVETYGREIQGIEIPHERAAAIAGSIEPLAAAARRAAESLPFDSEPADFVRAQRRWMEPKP